MAPQMTDTELTQLRNDYIEQYTQENRKSFCDIALRQVHWVATERNKSGEQVISKDSVLRNTIELLMEQDEINDAEFRSVLEHLSAEDLIIIGF
jgi:hypothetical protein